MRIQALCAWATSLLLAGTATALHLKDGGARPAVVGLDIERRHVENPVARDRLRRRQDQATNVILDNQRNLYLVNASLGTPPQQIRFHLDTGSSDLWTNAPSSLLCQSITDPCDESGTYNANTSSTYRYIDSNFRIAYVDGSGARGDHAADTVRIGDVVLDDLQFGIGYRSTSGESILGIGYTTNEAQVARGVAPPYPNLPELMARTGQINSNAYSLWLNDLDASTGSLLFGGVNTEKYVGRLATLPIQNTFRSPTPTEFIITLTDLSFGENGRDDYVVASDRAYPVLLDSGSSLTYLPDDLALEVMNAVGVEYDRRNEVGLVACSLANNATSLNFRFSEPVISVPMNELVLPPQPRRYSSNLLTLADGRTEACLFGVVPAGSNPSVLGDTFLRSAYVVYDLENHEISIAPTNFNATADRILEIGRGEDAVPDADDVRNPVPAVAAPGGARIGNFNGATATGGLGARPTGAAASVTGNGLPRGGLVAGFVVGISWLGTSLWS